MQPTVLYRDSELLAVAKAPGELVHNSAYAGPKEISLRERVIALEGHPVFPVHRLDRGTSGIVWFARTREAVAPLSLLLAASHKRYIALVRGHFFGAAWVDHPLTDDRGVSQPAQSSLRELARSEVERVSAVEVMLVTGRTHQVRRHCKHLSHPLLGDVKYGKGPFNRLARDTYGLSHLALHAARVDVTLKQRRVTILAPPPPALASACAALFPRKQHDTFWQVFDRTPR